MALITVDTEKCINDELCQIACPGFLIEIDNNGLPHPVSYIEDNCVRCGHCVAICPTDALFHSDLPQNEFIETKEGLEMNPEAVGLFIKSRRSIRNYQDKPVPRELIENVIDIARYAPTGHNDQGVKYSIFDNKESLKNIADSVIDFFKFLVSTNQDQGIPFDFNKLIAEYENGVDVILRQAPVLIVTHEMINPMAGISSHIALTTLELAAKACNLGTCWAGFVMMAAVSGYEPLLKLFHLPEGQQFCGAMIMGHPQLKYKKIPVRNKPTIIWND